MNVDSENKIYEFEEKPDNPKSNLASMGVYIFNWKVLRSYLLEDELDLYSSNDFGKNIIPKMLKNDINLYSYLFDGYWKDVGNVKSLWEANMDLLKSDNKLNLYDKNWKIYSNNPINPPQYILSNNVKSSILNEGCIVHGSVENSVLFSGVYIGKNSRVIDSVIMPGARIEDNVSIRKSIVMSDVVIKCGDRIENHSDEVMVISE